MIYFYQTCGSIIEDSTAEVLVVGAFLAVGVGKTTTYGRFVVIDMNLFPRLKFVGNKNTLSIGIVL